MLYGQAAAIKNKDLTILLVEDEILLQDVYKLVLNSQGYTVYVAGNGRDGITLLKKHCPQVVLLDIFMPVMDGKDFLRNFDTKAFPQTKIIVYSNLIDDGVEQEMRALGAHQVVLKSTMAPKDLVELIHDTAKFLQ